jgi:hypothetical protein
LVEESGFLDREKHCLPHAFHQLLFCMEPDLLIFLYLSLFWTDKKHKKPAASSIAFFLPPSLLPSLAQKTQLLDLEVEIGDECYGQLL